MRCTSNVPSESTPGTRRECGAEVLLPEGYCRNGHRQAPRAAPACTCLSISRDPLCWHHGDADKLRALYPAAHGLPQVLEAARPAVDEDAHLSVAETQKLLGAERPISIGKVPTDPIGMRTTASIVRERLITWDSEHERLACQCLMSDSWRCNTARRRVGTGLGTIGCPCECHRYAHRQAAQLDAAHPSLDALRALTRCPACGSPDQARHPAVQHEGEVQVCAHPWHASTDAGRRALESSRPKPTPDAEQVRERARQATHELRDAAREGTVIYAHHRDQLVKAVHAAIDLSEAPDGIRALSQRWRDQARAKWREDFALSERGIRKHYDSNDIQHAVDQCADDLDAKLGSPKP